MNSITNTTAWRSLQQHQQKIADLHMRDLFANDSLRFSKFSLNAVNILLDYSKNRITDETLRLLIDMAVAAQVPEKIRQLFSGAMVNSSENRPALHTALRQTKSQALILNGENVTAKINAAQEQLEKIVNSISQQQWRGFTNKPLTDIVNIGIGGSDLGPALVTQALKTYAQNDLNFHFISNIDGSPISELLKHLNPEQTLFIVSSKYFGTQETLCNANTAKRWLLKRLENLAALKQHFIAITAKADRALDFGIAAENILPLWEWVGGRYSVWSAVGLPIALSIGMKKFQDFLAGAAAMDQHCQTAPLEKNMPMILALLSVWYSNFFATQSQAILPYDHSLQLLPTYLQQAHMESHGKQCRQNGKSVDYVTGGVIWGGVGTNGQHTFHQLLHQGTHLIPVDFIVAARKSHDLPEHHAGLFANCLSQSQALMHGKTAEEILQELVAAGMTEDAARELTPHKVIPGNRPSNTIVLPELTPFNLGALIALYEHKIFIQGAIWDINCFDQWGVELGKQLANPVLQSLQNKSATAALDSSTAGLIDYFHMKDKLI